MLNYIKDTLGVEITEEKCVITVKFPLFLKNEYEYRQYKIEGVECLFVKPTDFSLPKYKKHLLRLRELTNLSIVLELENITPYQRKSLIEEKIPFVVKNNQMYMSFLAINLTEKFEKKTVIEKFAPLTQLAFLYVFYKNVKLTATEIAKRLDCTAMSAVRACKSLVDSGLFIYETEGRKKYIVPKFKGGELLKRAETYLISPVESVNFVSVNESFETKLISGIYALSEKTMLSVNDNDKSYAIYKKDKINSMKLIPKDECDTNNTVKIEKWCYNPNILSDNVTVDDISLVLSLSNEKDERVMMSIEEIKRKYEW